MRKEKIKMQTIYKMKLNTIDDVKSFVDAANDYNKRVTVRNMHYAVDGKSIMGIFSIDLSGILDVEFEDEPENEELNKFSKWII